jgi:hypothetical protein
MPLVFDDIERDQAGPASQSDTQFSYLNRSSRIEAERVRGLIEDWISRYPAEHRKALTTRMRSTIDSAHYSAFFELALHEMLLSTGHNILEVEPTVPHSQNKPDFLVCTAEDTCFYLEAAVSMNEVPQKVTANKRLSKAVGIIDRADAKFHYLDLQIDGKPTQEVKLGHLRSELTNWIARLPNTEEAKAVPAFIYEEYGMKLTVSALLRRTPLQERDRAIGIQGLEPYWATSGEGVRESVKKKASRYGNLAAPYVVAINAMGNHQGEEDAIDAMFGSPCVVIRTYEDGRVEHRNSRNPDGVWHGRGFPRKKGLSAILSTERFYPWSVGQRRARLIRNPWATSPFPACSFRVDEMNLVKSHLMRIHGQSFSEIFGLPPNWPED